MELRRRREEAMKQAGKSDAPPSGDSIFNALKRDIGDGPDIEAIEEALLQGRINKSQPNPQIAEIVTVQLNVARDAAPGVRELRLKTPSGMSNPMYFQVGEWHEYYEREPNDKKAVAGVPEWMPAIVNGQIMPGDVDRFRFRAVKGSRVVAAVSARSLIPYLADAVPGWFQATLTLYDPKGRAADAYRELAKEVIDRV